MFGGRISPNATCLFCNEEEETMEHILRVYPTAAAVWYWSPLDLKVQEGRHGGWQDWLASLGAFIGKGKL